LSLDEKSQKLGEVLARLRDGLQGLQPAVEAINAYLNNLLKSSESGNWNPHKIKWVEDSGFKGPYERYPPNQQKAEATDDYKNMLSDLKTHDGKLTRDGMFYWVFEDATTVGRKKKQ